MKKTSLISYKPVETPMEANLKLQVISTEEVVNREQFHRHLRSLTYLLHTELDIIFAVSVMSQFMQSPGQKHSEVVYWILKYLKGTLGRGLLFTNHGHLKIEAYTDVDWVGSIMDRRFTLGYYTFIGGNLITWRSKK